MFDVTIKYHTNASSCCVAVCCIPCSGDRSERWRVYFAHLHSMIKHDDMALPNQTVVTVRSAAGFERHMPMEVVKV